jgi:hypothetical protein
MLLYKYRFLNRIQIQALMGHKDKKTINMWLRDLKAKEYIEWIYNPDHFAEKTKPAIYYIGINGVRYFKTIQATDDTPWFSIEDIRKRYKEAKRSQTFIDHCMLIADCCVDLAAHSDDKTSYECITEADYRNEHSQYHFFLDNDLVTTNLLFVKTERKKSGNVTTPYLLEIFDATMPRYRIKKRLANYIEYLDYGDWQSQTNDDKPPLLLFVCPRTSDLIYAKRRTRGLLADEWDEDESEKPGINFTTIEKLKAGGLLAGGWEKA